MNAVLVRRGSAARWADHGRCRVATGQAGRPWRRCGTAGTCASTSRHSARCSATSTPTASRRGTSTPMGEGTRHLGQAPAFGLPRRATYACEGASSAAPLQRDADPCCPGHRCPRLCTCTQRARPHTHVAARVGQARARPPRGSPDPDVHGPRDAACQLACGSLTAPLSCTCPAPCNLPSQGQVPGPRRCAPQPPVPLPRCRLPRHGPAGAAAQPRDPQPAPPGLCEGAVQQGPGRGVTEVVCGL
jgi:hypothetical protein